MGFFSGKTEVVVPTPPPRGKKEKRAFEAAAGTLGIESGRSSGTRPRSQPRGPLGALGRLLQEAGLLQPLGGEQSEQSPPGGGAAADLDRQKALEEEQLGIQRGFVGPQGDLQQLILQTLMSTLGPEGIEGTGGLVSQAFARTGMEGRRAIDEFFQNAGFLPQGTTPATQARGEFEGELASAKAQAILDQLRFSLDRGLTASSQQPFVPGFQGQPLPSTGLGINLGQAQGQLGGTLGNIRMAGFRPEVLQRQGIGGDLLGLAGTLGGAFLGGPGGAALGSKLGSFFGGGGAGTIANPTTRTMNFG